jgi:hypothetical protein
MPDGLLWVRLEPDNTARLTRCKSGWSVQVRLKPDPQQALQVRLKPNPQQRMQVRLTPDNETPVEQG